MQLYLIIIIFLVLRLERVSRPMQTMRSRGYSPETGLDTVPPIGVVGTEVNIRFLFTPQDLLGEEGKAVMACLAEQANNQVNKVNKVGVSGK